MVQEWTVLRKVRGSGKVEVEAVMELKWVVVHADKHFTVLLVSVFNT